MHNLLRMQLFMGWFKLTITIPPVLSEVAKHQFNLSNGLSGASAHELADCSNEMMLSSSPGNVQRGALRRFVLKILFYLKICGE